MNTRFQMTRISVPQFAILAERMPDGKVSLNTELEFKYNADAPNLMTAVRFKFISETTEVPLLVLEVACEFAVHPDDWGSLKKDGSIDIPVSLMEIMAVHTIGTSRGIMHCKTEDTPFSGVMIPPLNVRKILEK